MSSTFEYTYLYGPVHLKTTAIGMIVLAGYFATGIRSGLLHLCCPSPRASPPLSLGGSMIALLRLVAVWAWIWCVLAALPAGLALAVRLRRLGFGVAPHAAVSHPLFVRPCSQMQVILLQGNMSENAVRGLALALALVNMVPPLLGAPCQPETPLNFALSALLFAALWFLVQFATLFYRHRMEDPEYPVTDGANMLLHHFEWRSVFSTLLTPLAVGVS